MAEPVTIASADLIAFQDAIVDALNKADQFGLAEVAIGLDEALVRLGSVMRSAGLADEVKHVPAPTTLEGDCRQPRPL